VTETTRRRTALNVIAVVLLLTTAAILEVRQLSSLSSIAGADMWWHLRTGTWILQNHSLPRCGLFSQSAGSRWVDSSWGFDVMVADAYRLLGLRAVPAPLMCFRVALAVLAFSLAAGWRGPLWPVLVLSISAQYVLGGLQSGPAYCSVLLFGVELLLLLDARRTGDVRWLSVLPVLFFFWANLDEQFVIGLGLLLLFLFASVLEDFLAARFPEMRPLVVLSVPRLAAVAALCFVATLLTPYFVRPYQVFFIRFTSAATPFLPDFHAMNFKQPQDYLLLLLTMAAYVALGRRHSRDIFQIALVVGCTLLSFHAKRDIWLVTLAATAVLGEALRSDTTGIAQPRAVAVSPRIFRVSGIAAIAAGTAAVLLVAVLRIPGDRNALLAKAARTYPVAACNIIRERGLPAPLFNAYEWGGFLQWYLPEYPVALDSRPMLYSDDVIIRYSKVMNADLPYLADPALAGARTILFPRHSLMGEALSNVPAFQVAYSDDVAVVLIRGQS
jgi:hypothetical protein